MTDYRKLIRKLATDPSVQRGNLILAEKIRARAAQIDPTGDFKVFADQLVVNGLSRSVAVVVNNSPGAGRSEFGRGDQGGGLRPLGRATRSVKG